jgi:hypothetical protein
LVLAQLIDGRVAFFVGAGTALAVADWRRGLRTPATYGGIAVATVVGLIVALVLISLAFFRSSALLGWVALLIGLGTTWALATAWTRRQVEASAIRELGMPAARAREVLKKVGAGDREGAMNEIAAWQSQGREALKQTGIDLSSFEPEVGKVLPWDGIVRQVFRVLDFDRSDTTIDAEGRVKAGSMGRPYGYLRAESPILNRPARIPIVHRDDFALAASVFDEPNLADHVRAAYELLVTYAPKRMLPGGLNGSAAHCLHYVICPRGTLERYYPNTLEGDARMQQPTPEILFGSFVYEGQIQVGRNLTPAL